MRPCSWQAQQATVLALLHVAEVQSTAPSPCWAVAQTHLCTREGEDLRLNHHHQHHHHQQQ